MPWSIKEQEGQWCVIKDGDGEVEGCHATEADAGAQLKALYASEDAAAGVVTAESELPTADAPVEGEITGQQIIDALELVKNPLGTLWGQPAIPIDPAEPPDPKVIEALQEVAPDDEPVTAALTPELEAVLTRPEQWHALSLPLDTRSGDGRIFEAAGLSWRDLPTPLKWAPESYGEHMGAIVVGATTRREVVDGALHSWGVFALREDGSLTEDAAKAVEAIRGGMLSGVSIEVDDVKDADIELVWPEEVALTEDPDEMVPLMPEGEDGTAAYEPDEVPLPLEAPMPDEVIFHHFRVAADCLVDVPAFPEAFMEITGELPMSTLTEIMGEPDDSPVLAAGYVIEIPDCPPSKWFGRPTDEELSVASLTMTDEGRLYGWLAPPGTFHQGRPDRVKAPQGVDYSKFLSKETLCSDGRRVVCGNLTMNCGHAPISSDLHAASEHYDNSCSIFAQINVGEYKGGTWMAGAVLPDVDPHQVRRALSCQASGDWRARDDGKYGRKLAAALLVPVPGFAKSRAKPTTSVRSENGELQLVASAVPVTFRPGRAANRQRKLADRIARTIGMDHPTRAASLAERVLGSSVLTAANDEHDEKGRLGSGGGGAESKKPTMAGTEVDDAYAPLSSSLASGMGDMLGPDGVSFHHDSGGDISAVVSLNNGDPDEYIAVTDSEVGTSLSYDPEERSGWVVQYYGPSNDYGDDPQDGDSVEVSDKSYDAAASAVAEMASEVRGVHEANYLEDDSNNPGGPPVNKLSSRTAALLKGKS